MKKFRKIMLVAALALIAIGVAVSFAGQAGIRKSEKEVRYWSDQVDRLESIELAIDMKTDANVQSWLPGWREKWPDFDTAVRDYASHRDILEDHLNEARAGDTEARRMLSRVKYGRGNAILFMTLGGVLLVVWIVLTAKRKPA